MRSSFALHLGAALGLSVAAVAGFARAAEPPASPDRPAAARLVLDAPTRAEILDSLVAQVSLHYVEADTARLIADAVRERAKAGAYDAITDPDAFSEAVTRDLRRVNGDLHLGLRYDPNGTSALARPMIVRRITSDDARGGAAASGAPDRRVVVREGPGGGPDTPVPGMRRVIRGPAPDDSAARGFSPFVLESRQHNFGLTKMEILPGNVGYLEVSGFMGTDGYEDALGDAMRFLARTDAVIIDVRRNGGGNGEMSHLLFSHFLPATPVPTIRVKTRDADEPMLMHSVADVPGPRRTDVPLYVLTSRGTASAAEEFSFVLKNRQRATLVGDRTAGAGHMVGGFPATHGFIASVSITRVSDPTTGAEWEGIGVAPDVKVAPEQALATAHALALRALAAKATDEPKKTTLERTAEWVEARANPATLDRARLDAMIGTYEGDRRVEVVDGKPTIRLRPGTMPEELVPMPDGSFALLMSGRLHFASGNPSPSVTVNRADGSTSTYARIESRYGDTQ